MDDYINNMDKKIKNREMKIEQLLSSGFQGEQMIVVPKGNIKKFSEHGLIGSLYLTDIGFFPKASNHFRDRPRGCKEFILIYCIEGKGVVEQKGKSYEVPPNTFFIIEKDIPHTYRSNKQDPWSIYWIHFSGTQSRYLYNRFKRQNNKQPIFIPFSQNRISEFEYLLDLLRMGYTDQIFEYSSMLLHKLLGSFIYYAIRSKSNPDIKRNELVQEITSYLNDRIYETITLKDVERKFNRSSSTLFSSFKEKTGYSIMQFFSLIKIQKACELMNLTDLSIKEISYKLDYQDPLYFSRVFKKFMGVSPMQYRKSY